MFDSVNRRLVSRLLSVYFFKLVDGFYFFKNGLRGEGVESIKFALIDMTCTIMVHIIFLLVGIPLVFIVSVVAALAPLLAVPGFVYLAVDGVIMGLLIRTGACMLLWFWRVWAWFINVMQYFSNAKLIVGIVVGCLNGGFVWHLASVVPSEKTLPWSTLSHQSPLNNKQRIINLIIPPKIIIAVATIIIQTYT